MASGPTAWQFLERASRVAGERTFVRSREGDLTYAEAVERAARLAAALEALGIGRGSRVSVAMASGLDLLAVFFAIARCGAVYVPAIPDSTAAEVAHVVGHSESQALVCSPAELTRLREQGFDFSSLEAVAVSGAEELGDAAALELLAAGAPRREPAAVGPDDPLAIMYTSGSTGRPKGVVLPQAGVAKAGFAKADRLSYGPEDCVLCVLPLYHVGGIHYCLAPAIARGSAVMLQPKFSVSRFWDDVRSSGATGGLLMPAMMSMLLTAVPSPRDMDHGLRVVCSHFVDEEFRDRFGVDVVTTWSLSESSGIGVYSKPGYAAYEERLIGWPLGDAEVRVVDERGGEVDRGAIGELAVRHDAMMSEYWREPEQTGLTLRDGWLHSGDLGRMDERGRLFFEGRVKNMIKRSGENISAEEVEGRLGEHPAVRECVVLGVPDPIRTEEAKAFVAIDPDAGPAPEELARWCAAALSDFKVPRYFQFVDALPRNATAKVDRPALRDMAVDARCWDRQHGDWTGVPA